MAESTLHEWEPGYRVSIFAMITTNMTTMKPKRPLRRATYIQVQDLTKQYNINDSLLEQEFIRVNNKEHHLPNSETDSDAVSSKRLYPPRGGFNLCL